MKRLLSIFLMGSELRQFHHSGLFQGLLDSGWEVTVMAKVVDQDLRGQLDLRIQLVPLVKALPGFLANQLSIVLDQAHQLRRVREGKTTWKYVEVKPKNWRQALLIRCQNLLGWLFSRFRPLASLASRLETELILRGDRTAWKEFFKQNLTSALLVNLPRHGYWDPMLATAQEMGIKTFLLYHTWKDLTAAGRLNHPWTGIGVWNQRMKADLLAQNPWLDPESVRVVGCGHFDCLGRSDNLVPEAAFRSSIGAEVDSRLILFPTSGPGVVPEEEKYIAILMNVLRGMEIQSGKKFQVVFRMNPMDNRPDFIESLRRSYPDHIVLRPDWRDDRRIHWGFTRQADIALYNSLLHYAVVCVGIPSTVTVDSAIADLPVVNLAIELPGKQPLPGSLRAFWEVDFYRNVRETGAARLVTTEEELKLALESALNWPRLDQVQRKTFIEVELDGICSGSASRLSQNMMDELTP